MQLQLSVLASAPIALLSHRPLHERRANKRGQCRDLRQSARQHTGAHGQPVRRISAAEGAGARAERRLYYVGKRPVNNENQVFVDGYTSLSLGARYTTRIAGKRSTIQAVLDNATDENYWSNAGGGLLGVGAPRTLKVTAKVEF